MEQKYSFMKTEDNLLRNRGPEKPIDSCRRCRQNLQPIPGHFPGYTDSNCHFGPRACVRALLTNIVAQGTFFHQVCMAVGSMRMRPRP